MKYIKYSIVVLSIMLLATFNSCKKFLDINTSPLTATDVEAKLLFGYAVTAWDANKNSGDMWMPVGLMAQNLASGGDYGWGRDNVYNLSPYSIGNTFKVYYSTAGNNLKQAINIAESAEPINNNIAAQSKIVLAQLMYEATVLFGDVPFVEAFDPVEFPYPKYDDQKSVFESIISLLDEAHNQIDENDQIRIDDYDIFYNGDLSKWKKLAKSLKFRVLMTMVDADETKKSEIGEMLSNESVLLTSASDNWLVRYYNQENNENPKYRLFKEYTDGRNLWFFANNNVFKYMQESDPRIPKYFDLGSGKGVTEYKAVETEAEADTTTSLISSYLYRPNAPSLILSYQELTLLKAEAYARGLGVAVDLNKANTLYKEGVKAAMQFYEADEDDISNYLENDLEDLTQVNNPIELIHLQQWIDLMDRPLEAFTQWRRSGTDGNETPLLTLPTGATQGPLIRRFILSPDEIAANPNIPSPQPKYYDKMWFDL